ncbi:hypothetical protein THAOC_19792 [Thalassiosira oceanica]|uniref:Cytochrome b5 heme-binding domain-containing protein n=1 Tax=Thalassiosira oceanica TaxID=159749 RepID=K0SN85_THAOC|nr:hypothetical protein THAOC_19792 [Thalassiosira oceanica]|eukprot:EJK59932.1 hypothetical protein THAOC_19792 [Thalassiosira oceanica]
MSPKLLTPAWVVAGIPVTGICMRGIEKILRHSASFAPDRKTGLQETSPLARREVEVAIVVRPPTGPPWWARGPFDRSARPPPIYVRSNTYRANRAIRSIPAIPPALPGSEDLQLYYPSRSIIRSCTIENRADQPALNERRAAQSYNRLERQGRINAEEGRTLATEDPFDSSGGGSVFYRIALSPARPIDCAGETHPWISKSLDPRCQPTQPRQITGTPDGKPREPADGPRRLRLGLAAVGGGHISELGGRTFESRARSIAGSAALVPKAKYSWASESLGTQSTVMTRRSLATASVPEPEITRREGAATEGRIWASFAWMITFFIPNKCIMRNTKDAKQAWREKVALFVIMVSCSVFFVGVFGFVPLLLCKEDSIFSMSDIWLQTGENWVVVHGIIYDVKDLIYRHPGGVDGIVDFLGKDASKVFPRAPPVQLPQKCLDMVKVEAYSLNVEGPMNNFTNPTCAEFTELDMLLGITCHTFAAGSQGVNKFLGDFNRGELSHTTPGLNELGIHWVAIYDRVYDVTTYVDAIRENQEPAVGGGEPNLDNNPAAYLH